MTTVLVIDDSPTVGCTVEWALRDYGYTVHIAQNGLAALSELRSIQPNLILLDIRMPHIDGVQLCTMLRQNPDFDDIPIVMLSGLSTETDINRALDAGADDFLVKPVDDQALVDVIEHYVLAFANTPVKSSSSEIYSSH